MLNIQDDADYQLDEDFWTYSLGEGGELLLNEKFVGGIVVNVDPYYSCIIKLEGAYPEVDFNAVSDEHEFCGVLVINDEEEDE